MSNNKLLKPPTTAIDIAIELLTHAARKYFFLKTTRKAVIYFFGVSLLSILAEYLPLSDHYYITQKHNVFNQYGTKLGWFWTLLILAPFVCCAPLFRDGFSKARIIQSLIRLAINTGVWYYTTNAFVKFERATGRCYGAEQFSRSECNENNGKWMPGFDISGHCFILTFANMMISEEALAFRYWSASHPTNANDRNENEAIRKKRQSKNEQRTHVVSMNFIILFFISLLWDFQLIITCLYYHTAIHKIMGTAFALIFWCAGYKFLYPNALFL